MSRRLIVIVGALSLAVFVFVSGCDIKDFDGPDAELEEKGVSLSRDQVSISEANADPGVIYDVRLGKAPDDTVVVTIASAEGWVTVEPDTLIFLQNTWNTAIGVTVRAIDNFLDDDSVAAQDSLMHEVVSGDVDYNGMAVASIPVFVTDDDISGLALPDSLVLPVNRPVPLDMSLTCKPVNDVMIELSVSNLGADIEFSPPMIQSSMTKSYSFTFTQDDWNEPQGVGVVWNGDTLEDDVTLDFKTTSDDGNYHSGEEVYHSIPVSGTTMPFWSIRFADGQAGDEDEGDPGSPGTFPLVIELSEGSGSVRVLTSAGTGDHGATEGDDFVGVDKVVYIAAGNSTSRDTIVLVGDEVFEYLEESFTVRLQEPSAETWIPDGQLDLTIRDDEEFEISVTDTVFVIEGDDAQFIVTPDLPAAQRDVGISLIYSTYTGGSFTADPGDIADTGDVTFPIADAEDSVIIDVTTIADPGAGPDETFGLWISSGDSRVIGPDDYAVGVIQDATGFVLTEFSDVEIVEGDGGGQINLEFTITTSAGRDESWTLFVSTIDGTASSPGDFQDVANHAVVFPASVNTASFSIPTIKDSAVEDDETFSVVIDTNGTGLEITTVDLEAQATIRDDDGVTLDDLSNGALVISDDDWTAEGGTDLDIDFEVSTTLVLEREVPLVFSLVVENIGEGEITVEDVDWDGTVLEVSLSPAVPTATAVVQISDDRTVELPSEKLRIHLDQLDGNDVTSGDIYRHGLIDDNDSVDELHFSFSDAPGVTEKDTLFYKVDTNQSLERPIILGISWEYDMSLTEDDIAENGEESKQDTVGWSMPDSVSIVTLMDEDDDEGEETLALKIITIDGNPVTVPITANGFINDPRTRPTADKER